MTTITNVVTIKKIERIETLPDGTYLGNGSGYTVKVLIDSIEYELVTDMGVRGINEPCKVTVTNGQPVVSY